MKGLLFTYLLTYGGASVSLLRPFYGLLIYICFALIRPTSLWHWSVPEGNYSRIVAIGLLVGWAMHGFGRWNLGRAGLIVFALVMYLLWSVLSAASAMADSTVAFNQVEEYAKVVLPFLVGITMIQTETQLRQLAWVLVLSQGYLAYEFNLMYYQSPWFQPNEWNFGGLDRNGIAITMVTSAGLAFFLGLDSAKLWQKALAFVSAALMVHVILFSMSRGGMLALLITGAMSFVLLPKRPAYLALFLLAVVVGLRLAGPMVWARFSQSFGEQAQADGSAMSRLELWGTFTGVIFDHPILGIGPQNWRLVAHHYGFTEGKDGHTTWLQVAAEMGAAGLFWLLLFYGSCAARLWCFRSNRADIPQFQQVTARMVLAALAGFVVSAQFVSVYGIELPFYIVLLGAGSLKVYASQASTESQALALQAGTPLIPSRVAWS